MAQPLVRRCRCRRCWPLKLNRDRVWQIVKPVEEGSDKSFFYNAFEYSVEVGGVALGKARGFLRGMFGFSKSDSAETGSRLGVDLEFTYNGIKPFGFTNGASVEAVVDDVEDGGFSSLQVPGPIGVTGRLRNSLYRCRYPHRRRCSAHRLRHRCAGYLYPGAKRYRRLTSAHSIHKKRAQGQSAAALFSRFKTYDRPHPKKTF